MSNVTFDTEYLDAYCGAVPPDQELRVAVCQLYDVSEP